MDAPNASASDFASCPFDALRSRSPELLLASGAPSTLVVGDAREVLAWLPKRSIQTCVTSPPYWHVRDYGIDGQVGLESDLDDYLAALVEVFAEVRRVLHEDGTLWLNIGDGYTSGGRRTRAHERLFLLAKNPRYHYDHQAVRGPNDRNLRSVWPINTQPGRHGHIAPFPEALAEQCLRLTSRPGDLILDPFLGSATSAAVATRLGRRWLGIEPRLRAACATAPPRGVCLTQARLIVH